MSTESGRRETPRGASSAAAMRPVSTSPSSRQSADGCGWIFFIQVTSYIGKLLIHPTPIGSVDEFFARATIGPVPGQLVLLAGLLS